MQIDSERLRKLLSGELMELAIRVGLVALLVVISARIFAPFASLMLWALVLAIAFYPLHQQLAKRLGGRQGSAATLIVLAALLITGLPTVMLGSSFAGNVHDFYTAFENNEIVIAQPSPSVADWPLVGKTVHDTWSAAASDLPALIEELRPQLGNMSKRVLSIVASTAGGVFLFLGSLIIAGIMMAYGAGGSEAMKRILIRLSGPEKGPRLHGLSVSTVRSVATGVVGVAFIQALLLGIGFLVAGIPAAGVLALVVMVLGIAQLPAVLVSVPAIAYLWIYGDASTMANTAFTVYLLVAGMADNVLKPILLGRGVDVPMPVILLGALGGMVSAGIIGLFLGAVVLAVGYEVFMDWVDEADEIRGPEPDVTEMSARDPAPGS